MPDINALAGEIGRLFTGVANDVYGKFKQEDKDQLMTFAKNVAGLTVKLQAESDPAKRAEIIDNLRTYENATQLMVARYEIIAANALEKAGTAALKLVVETLIKIIVAAV
jgi:hypothetical protein